MPANRARPWDCARACALAAVITACGSSAPPRPAPAPIAAATRTSIETELTAGDWVDGYSGSTVWIWHRQRFVLPDRVEDWNGTRPHGGGAPAPLGAPQVGTFRITPTGAIEQTLAGLTSRRTFVIAPGAGGARVWSEAGYVALGSDRRRFRRESARRSPTERGYELECDLDLPAALETLETSTCRMRVHVRARTFDGARPIGERDLDVEGGCTVDRAGPLVRVSFEGFESVDPVQASAEWSNWLSRTGRDDPGDDTTMHDVLRGAFVPVLAYDPSAPSALFAAFVTGPSRTPPE